MKANLHGRRASKAKGQSLATVTEEEISQLNTPVLADYLLPDELADELGVCVETIKRWHRAGRGPPKTFVGRRIYYSRTSIAAWLRTREQRSNRDRSAVAAESVTA
jgi:hypothetical protein